MRHKRNDGEEEQQVNQAARYMEHQEATGPQNDQQQSNHEKRSESHLRLLGDLTFTMKLKSPDSPFALRLYGERDQAHIGIEL
jgi:hypothetical protein